MNHIFQLNYYSIGYVSATMFSIFLLIYLVTLPKKSKQTRLLIGYFLFTLIFNFGFLLRASVFSEDIAKPASFLIALYTCFANVMLVSFVYSFPRNRTEKEAQSIVFALIFAGCAGYSYYVLRNLYSPVSYNFDTQLYEFQTPESTAPMGILHFLTFIWILIVIFRKTIQEEKEFRIDGNIKDKSFFRLFSPNANILRSLGWAVLLHTCFSSIYVLYATNRIPFAYFQLLLTTAASLQLFIYTIIYLNNSPQPSTFMIKIVGVTLVSILIILTIVSKFAFRINEVYFDEIRNLEIKEVIRNINHLKEKVLSDNLLYIVSLSKKSSLSEDHFRIQYSRLDEINEEVLNSSDIEKSLRNVWQNHLNESHESIEWGNYSELDKTPSMQISPRMYRSLKNKNKIEILTIYYLIKDGDNIYEIAYPFQIYSKTVHSIAITFLIIILITALSIILLFPYFFYRGLIRPLLGLLNGVKEVNEGKYNVKIPIHAEDEIGFLSRSFNHMVDSIRSSQERLKEFAETLEEKVKKRTFELQQSLDKVQELKTKQDSDYYLTSLLIQPLAQNKSDSENVFVEFLTEQKKKFQFKRWSSEIGGDLCVSSKISLKGRNYTAILNGDAMGKSMQGAGGALVLGSVFKAILERSRYLDIMSSYPETWLKNTFIELHNIFISFDGTMLASGFISLLDDESGLLYYVNAAHPLPVFYRQGIAMFLPHKYQYRKLGMQISLETDLFINLFKLEPDDVIIIASDGREDILIEDENGENMNDNEDFFLQCVELGNGRLQNILQEIKSRGEIVDDISLIRVEYKPVQVKNEIQTGEYEEIINRAEKEFRQRNYENAISVLHSLTDLNDDYKKDARILKQLTKSYFQTKNYKKTLNVALSYLEIAPEESEIIFIIAECYWFEGDLKRAADFGERLRLRSPEHKKNSILLSEIYKTLGKYDRAKSMIAEIKYFEKGEYPF
ncbi:HAMP domain-containing protein [Leptospira stimsonii]|uniref:HAMP domain-containing protein n=1 Tax=Leptospira stimsonii TaxID=2202203 RepID=A0ABY2MWD2_9LEPT|nr:HAMP domain-containing protein [Leptospira stimsonii]TGM10373.1 HAMP domain-containing protein [Leptospira stimsonii]